jgi:tetratricopeptide (TPR) repeat protein
MFPKIKLSLIMYMLVCPSLSWAEQSSDLSILNSLPTTTSGRSLLIEGSFPTSLNVEGWKILVNDYKVFTLESQKADKTTPLSLVVTLREGDNLICFDSVVKQLSADSITQRRWCKHVLAEPDGTGQRYAVIIRGQSNDTATSDIDALRYLLRGSEIDSGKIYLASNSIELNSVFTSLAGRTASTDSILVYFRGTGIVTRSGGEPILQLPSGTSETSVWLSVGELMRRAAQLPSLSLVLDVDYHSYVQNLDGQITIQEKSDGPSADPNRRSSSWLYNLPKRESFEIAITNPASTERTPGELTHLLLSQIKTSHNICINLEESILPNTPIAMSTPSRLPPIYFNPSEVPYSYCLSSSSQLAEPIQINVAREDTSDPFMIVYDLLATPSPNVPYAWSEVWVDGTLVRHSSRRTPQDQSADISERVSFSEGSHLVEIRIGLGSKITASGRTEISIDVPYQYDRQVSNELHADILRPDRPTMTVNSTATVTLAIEDETSKAVHFELRNNGVVIFRGMAPNPEQHRVLELVRKIPLSPGANNFVLEVRNGDQIRFSSMAVTKRTEHPIHALLVGVDSAASSSMSNRTEADIQLMKKLLLRYTDIRPADMVVLAGKAATLETIRHAVSDSAFSRPNDPSTQGEPDDLLFFYFSGNGAAVGKGNKESPERCILPSDFKSDDLPQTCLSTTEMDSLLDSWPRSILLFDTSYDGVSGDIIVPSSSDLRLHSRTSRTFFAYDPNWRLSSGVDRPNRIIMAASTVNTPALDSAEPPGGLFTRSFTEAVNTEFADVNSDSTKTLELFDAFNSARARTVKKSRGLQTPLLKGFLSTPYGFAPRNTNELVSETDSILQNTFDDVQSLRSVNLSQVNQALDFTDTVIALGDDKPSLEQKRANLLIYLGRFEEAQSLIDTGTAANKSQITPDGNLAGWLLVRSHLRIRQGDVLAATRDCEQAVTLEPRLTSAKATLVGLYFANSRYFESAKLAKELMVQNSTSVDQSLTDDTWAHLVLFAYLSMKLSDQKSDANALINTYLDSWSANKSSGQRFGHALGKIFLISSDRKSKTELPVIQAPWFRVVITYFHDSIAGESDLRSFVSQSAFFDLKDSLSFECMLHFYLGMRLILDDQPATAKSELQLVQRTNQQQYVEYWAAKHELSELE